MTAEDLVANSNFLGERPDGTLTYQNSGDATQVFGQLDTTSVDVDLSNGVQGAGLPGGGYAILNPNTGQIRVITPDSPDIIIGFPQ
jgi:hypothetical protein